MESRRLAVICSHLCQVDGRRLPPPPGASGPPTERVFMSGCHGNVGGGEKAKGNCVFCMIVRGESPAFKIYEDDTCLCILDSHPLTRGGVLLGGWLIWGGLTAQQALSYHSKISLSILGCDSSFYNSSYVLHYTPSQQCYYESYKMQFVQLACELWCCCRPSNFPYPSTHHTSQGKRLLMDLRELSEEAPQIESGNNQPSQSHSRTAVISRMQC